MNRILSYYHYKMPMFLAYMFQQVEYNPNKFIRWIARLPDLTAVMRRQKLVYTQKARILVAIIYAFWVFYVLATLTYLLNAFFLGVICVIVSPFLVIILSYLVVLFGWLYVEEPRRSRIIKQGTAAFRKHPGFKIAIAGSYGKTSMKEILRTVLAEGLRVAATPGNRNVPVSHSAWIKTVEGDEDVLIVEFGEGAPGDIKKLAKLTQPDYGIITGLAPNHLDEYKTIRAVAKDLISLRDFVKHDNLYINETSDAFKGSDLSKFQTFGGDTVLGWSINRAAINLKGTTFTMHKNGKKIHARSGLLGRHNVAPLALSAALAFELGLSTRQIEAGLAKTAPFEHRMQPRQQHGAWIIDDTYNGSLEGIRAGLELLEELPAKNKIYVTPGLVDQGEETQRVHVEIGRLIAKAKPNRTILMQNSTTEYIVKGLEKEGYQGELQIQADPLAFYTNVEHILAAGDLVMMQNDWTDNYS